MSTSLRIVWDVHDNLVIRDIDVKWKERMLAFLRTNFIRSDPLFEIFFGCGVDYPELLESYMQFFKHLLLNECCLVAIDEKTDTVYAIAMVKWMTKEWHSWIDLKMKVKETSILSSVIEFSYKLLMKYADEHPDHPVDSLHLFDMYIDPKLEDDEVFMKKFFDAICETARHMKMPRVTTTSRLLYEHKRALDQDFVELERMIYSLYVVNGQRPFDCLRDNNEMFGSLFERLVDPLVPYDTMPVHEITFVYQTVRASAHILPQLIAQSLYSFRTRL